MPEHPLRKILSKFLRTGDPRTVTVTYLHRGAPNDSMTIRASEIVRVLKGSFLLLDEETQIPFHRVLEVKDEKTGIVSWTKRILPH